MKVGDFVYYIPYQNCDISLHELGRIKSVHRDNIVYVVFWCEHDWDNYTKYTGNYVSTINLTLKA